MKRSLIILLSAASALVFGACNKHSWDEEVEGRIPTKDLYKPHGHHGHDEDHKDHGKHADKEGEDHKKGEAAKKEES